MPVQVQCTMLDAWGCCAGKAQGDGMGRLGGRRVQDGEHVIFFLKNKIKKKKKRIRTPVLLNGILKMSIRKGNTPIHLVHRWKM